MKTLIVYTSKYGCTAKCAAILAEELGEDVLLANLAEGTPDLTDYDGIILGAPVYAGNIPGKAKKFLAKNLDQLMQKKVGLFICCGQFETGLDQLNTAYPKELTDCASAKASFGGAISLEKLNFLLRTMLKKIMKIKESFEYIDRRAITAFAGQWQS